MNQVETIYLHIKSTMNDSIIPPCLQTLYYALLKEGCTIKRFKKKWFRQHYTIQVHHAENSGHEEIHLKPNTMWWEYNY